MRRTLTAISLALTLAMTALAADAARPAPPLEYISHTGDRVKLSDYKGRVVVIEFLLTGCPGCKNSARILSGMKREYAAKGLEVLGLAIDPGAGPKIPQFVRETGANFPIGVYDFEKARGYLQYSVMRQMMMPQVAFVDRQGVLREHHGGDDPWMSPAMEEMNIRKLVEKLLAERAAPAKAPAKTPTKK